MRAMLFVLFAATAGLQAGCQEPSNAQEPAPAADAALPPARQVEVRRVAPEVFEERVEVAATVEAPHDATLSARTAGTVTFLEPLGARVAKGKDVARIDPEMARAAVAQTEAGVAAAEAAVALARDNYNRQKPLAEQQIISALEFQNIQAQLTQAEAQLRQAKAAREQSREQLGLTRVEAPFSGTVERRFVEQGEQVAPGSPVVRLVDTTVVRVRAGVPERYVTEIRPNASVRIDFNAYGLGPREGTVSFIGSTIDPETRTFPVEVTLENPDGVLKPEMVARLVLTRSRHEQALVIPQNAVVRTEEGEGVFVVVEQEGALVAERRQVKLGGRGEGRVVVTGGLAPGDQVVVRGQATLASGERVRISGEGT